MDHPPFHLIDRLHRFTSLELLHEPKKDSEENYQDVGPDIEEEGNGSVVVGAAREGQDRARKEEEGASVPVNHGARGDKISFFSVPGWI